MGIGTEPNLYIIGDYINSSVLTDSFKTTDVYKEDIVNQKFTKKLQGGDIELDLKNNIYTYRVTYMFVHLRILFCKKNQN